MSLSYKFIMIKLVIDIRKGSHRRVFFFIILDHWYDLDKGKYVRGREIRCF